MFPPELLGKLMDILLGEVAKDIFDRGSSVRRRFARDMLSYYEVIKEYRELCNDLIETLERERLLVPNKRITIGTAKRFQELSDKMSEKIYRIFETTEQEQDVIRKAKLGKSPRVRNSKRRLAIELYDKKLAELMNVANYTDYNTAYFASELSKQYIDWATQKIKLANIMGVSLTSIPIVPAWGRTQYNDMIPEKQSLLYKEFDFTQDNDFQELISIFQKNMKVIDRLVGRLRNFMKDNFTIDELL